MDAELEHEDQKQQQEVLFFIFEKYSLSHLVTWIFSYSFFYKLKNHVTSQQYNIIFYFGYILRDTSLVIVNINES